MDVPVFTAKDRYHLPFKVTYVKDEGPESYIIKIPEGTTYINRNAFYGCSNMIEVIIPESVEKILSWAFQLCSKLQSVNLPKVKKIGGWVFSDCFKLKSVKLSEGITYLGTGIFYRCYNLNSIILPKSTEHLGYNSFGKCISLQSITIPKNVKEVGDLSFCGCDKLKQIILLADINIELPKIDIVFANKPELYKNKYPILNVYPLEFRFFLPGKTQKAKIPLTEAGRKTLLTMRLIEKREKNIFPEEIWDLIFSSIPLSEW